jgi:hypothetical protein
LDEGEKKLSRGRALHMPTVSLKELNPQFAL